MTLAIDSGSIKHASLISRLGWTVLAVLLVAAIGLRHVVAANTDVSWLLTVGERVWNGDRLYVDVIETNPPMAVFAYLPGIAIGRVFSIAPETAIDALVFLAIAFSLMLAALVLKPLRAVTAHRWALLSFAFVVLAILPMQQFGQREHIALIALLPMLALWMRRAERNAAPWWAIVTAGIGAGLALMFKPYFMLGLGGGIVAVALTLRSWRALWLLENIIAASLVIVYAFSVAILYPEFFTLIGPLARDVYLPVGLPFTQMLAKPAIPIWLALMLCALLLKRRDRIDAPFAILAAASLGFAVVFLIQRKGWPYHSYPMIALAMLMLAHAISQRQLQNPLRLLVASSMLALGIAFMASIAWFDRAFDAKSLEARLARLGANPTILAITAEPGIGHPLVRALHGTWVSRQQGLWVTFYLTHLAQHGLIDPDRAAALDVHARRERAMLAEDIGKRPPSIVLVDNLTGDWSGWLTLHPDIASLLSRYRRVETFNGIDILTRD